MSTLTHASKSLTDRELWGDGTLPLDIIHTPEPLPAAHERASWLARLLRALTHGNSL